MCVQRRERARRLAVRFPACRQPLEFCAALVSFQERISARAADRQALPALLPDLQKWFAQCGTQQMREAAFGLDEAAIRQALEECWEGRDTTSLLSLFARAVLQPYAWAADLDAWRQGRPQSPSFEACRRCGHLPQAGVLRAQGHGRSLSLLCSLCLHEWPFSRGRCPACPEESAHRQASYRAEELPHIELHACDSCRSYLHWIDLSRDKEAVPDVDELAALPLDVWARGKRYKKVQLNWAGI